MRLKADAFYEGGYDVVYKAVMDRMKKIHGFMNETIIVRIGMKYEGEKEFTYDTYLLLNEGESWDQPKYIWEMDWWEGEQDIDLVFAAPVSAFENSPDVEYQFVEEESK